MSIIPRVAELTVNGSIAIVGAGPAGLTAAYLLSKAGVKVDIFESDTKYVGGISKTVEYKGFRFDIGGHRFFSKSQEVEDLWSEILPDDMITRDRLSRIFYRGKFYNYPLEAIEVLANLGKRESALSVLSYLKSKLRRNETPKNLEEWVTGKFGNRLYRTFFKSYTEKVWGRPCQDIAADWAAQRIKGLSLTTAILSSLRPKPNPSMNRDRSKQIKTLIKAFRYPRLGPGMMWESATKRICDLSGSIYYGHKVERFNHDPSSSTWHLEVKSDKTSTFGPYQHVISSAPLSSVITSLNISLPEEAYVAASNLTYRDFILVALILRPNPTFPDQWLYIHDPNLKVGRIQNFQNWSPDMVDGSGRRCYGMEYFCFEGDDLWNLADEALIQLATKEVVALGLAETEDVLDGCVVRQSKAYPVYDENYEARIKTIKDTLSQACPGLHQIGRNGMHRYNNQDHSMMTGMITANNILNPKTARDPWRVNQDAEYIEEETLKQQSQP